MKRRFILVLSVIAFVAVTVIGALRAVQELGMQYGFLVSLFATGHAASLLSLVAILGITVFLSFLVCKTLVRRKRSNAEK